MLDNQRVKIRDNFKSRNVEVEFFKSLDEVKNRVLNLISRESTVGVANSQTLKNMMISQELTNRGNTVYDKTFAKNKEESILLKKKALLTDWYITGTNAISIEGHIVNIDHSGNRVAAMAYGPDKVVVVVSKNKIEETLEKAITRARNHAAPLNAIRAGYKPPCIEQKQCIDCKSKERVCYNLSIIEGQFDPERMRLFIVDEEAGF
ncbi:MAG: lactate utilization protein [Clostridiaceae bacterium]|nr:lactate utilization protein [Clostridiaceae bacterium]